MHATRIWTALAICAGLAACGDTLGEQALFGAGAGALTSAALDEDLATGAVLGAAGNVLFCQEFPEEC